MNEDQADEAHVTVSLSTIIGQKTTIIYEGTAGLLKAQKLALPKLLSGLYLVKVSIQNRMPVVKKLVIQ